MSITGEQLLQLVFGGQHLQLCGGRGGLQRRIVWFHALESLAEVRFLQPGELVILTGISIGNDAAKLLKMVIGMDAHKSAGLIINTGRYITEIPAAVVQYVESHDLPLFILPWEIKLGDVTRLIGGLILAEGSQAEGMQTRLKELLLTEQPISGAPLEKIFWGEGQRPLRIQVIAAGLLPGQVMGTACAGYFQALFQNVFLAVGMPCLVIQDDDIFLLLVAETVGIGEVLYGKLADGMKAKESGLLVLGIGNAAAVSDAAALRRSCREARFALQVARQEHRCVYYQQTNIYRLFNHISDAAFLHDYAEEVLGTLLAYDKKTGSKFAETLAVYLESNEDTTETTQRLFIHRNTLTYRLKRIEEITHCHMGDSEARLNFRLAFKIQSFLRLVQND